MRTNKQSNSFVENGSNGIDSIAEFDDSNLNGNNFADLISGISSSKKAKSPLRTPQRGTIHSDVRSPLAYNTSPISKNSFDPKTTYQVDFKVYYKTSFGESLCIVGSIPELGQWKEFRCHMKWTDGHVWVTETPLITNHYYFQYKYVLLDEDKTKLISWERGIDRIADLEILPSMGHSLNSQAYEHSTLDTSKRVELKDEWESYTVTLSVLHPMEDTHDEMTMSGNLHNTHNVAMHRLSRAQNWMFPKYGAMMQPFECTIKFPNVEGSNFGQWKSGSGPKFCYSYQKRNDMKGVNQWEKEPKRTFAIQNPSDYRGQLGAQKISFQHHTDRVFIVNGNINKADGNFHGNFYFNKLGDTGLTIGSAPSTDHDILALRDAGVTAVLDV